MTQCDQFCSRFFDPGHKGSLFSNHSDDRPGRRFWLQSTLYSALLEVASAWHQNASRNLSGFRRLCSGLGPISCMTQNEGQKAPAVMEKLAFAASGWKKVLKTGETELDYRSGNQSRTAELFEAPRGADVDKSPGG